MKKFILLICSPFILIQSTIAANQYIKSELSSANIDQAVKNNMTYNQMSDKKLQLQESMSYDKEGNFNAASSALGTALATETEEQKKAIIRKNNALAEAIARKKAALIKNKNEIDEDEFNSRLKAGEKAVDIQADLDKRRSIRAKKPQERLANYLSENPQFEDKEFSNDVTNLSDFEIKALYGEDVLNAIMKKRIDDIKNYNTIYGRK